MPEKALREALLNAVVHRDYAVAGSIHIRVCADRLLIWNPGELPEGWSLGKLLGPHPSQPYNPDIANDFLWSGDIEAWGAASSVFWAPVSRRVHRSQGWRSTGAMWGGISVLGSLPEER